MEGARVWIGGARTRMEGLRGGVWKGCEEEYGRGGLGWKGAGEEDDGRVCWRGSRTGGKGSGTRRQGQAWRGRTVHRVDAYIAFVRVVDIYIETREETSS
jgi:hypothetical protein